MKVFTIFSCILMLFISSCNSRCSNDNSKKQSDMEEGARTDSANKLPDKRELPTDSIFMSVNQANIDITKDSTITVVIHNNTDTRITTGFSYEIDFLNDGEWERCEYSETIATIMLMVLIEPRAQHDFIIYLYPQYHKYEPGKYRIVKSVDYKDEEIEVIAYFDIYGQHFKTLNHSSWQP